MLSSVRIPVSMRRLEKEGIASLALKYLWCEIYALAGKPVRSMPFEYEFGAFQSSTPSKRRLIIDVAELRTQLGHIENPIQHLSQAGLDQLRRFAEFSQLDTAGEHVKLLLERYDLDILDRYLRRRLALIQEHKALKDGISKLKALPREAIQLLDIDWLHPFGSGDKTSGDEPH
jgi:hypothetical protein